MRSASPGIVDLQSTSSADLKTGGSSPAPALMDCAALVQCIRARLGPLGDVDLPQPKREGMREPPVLGGGVADDGPRHDQSVAAVMSFSACEGSKPRPLSYTLSGNRRQEGCHENQKQSDWRSGPAS
ncbi:hypothetical protein THIOKS12320014 [Thiocapsa sp. KS1]|nr:hypothetical protein THIOKS12320014 [Thiocapsa sp. KS1]